MGCKKLHTEYFTELTIKHRAENLTLKKSGLEARNKTGYRFNGKELDEETGNYYYGARYYDPKFAMWLSVDPMAEKYPSWSPYNYTLDNPVNLTDPDGRAPFDWIKNNKTGKIIWRNDVTGWSNTPKGYSYIGKTGQSIVNNLFGKSTFESGTTKNIGMYHTKLGDYGGASLGHASFKTSMSVRLNANITEKQNIDGSISKEFNGINVNASLLGTNSTQNIDETILGGTPTIDGFEMTPNFDTNVHAKANNFINFSGCIGAEYIQSQFGKPTNINVDFNGGYDINGAPLRRPTIIGQLLPIIKTKTNIKIPLDNLPATQPKDYQK